MVDQRVGFGRGFPLAGRRHELQRLLDSIRQPPAVVVVEGDAGMGKSRLVHEAATTLKSDGWRVVTGFCHPLREPLPYGPVVDALGKVRPWLPGTSLAPTAGALAPLVPDLTDLLPPVPPRPDGPAAARHQLVRAVRSVLAAIGRLVVVVEDVHWVDDATRELLLLLARDLPEQLVLVLTSRAEDLPDDTSVLGAGLRPTVIRLAPLGESDIAKLARVALGAGVTSELCAVLHRRSEGLPLVVEEDLLTFRDRARQDPRELEHADVPEGLRAAVTERLIRLSPAGAAVVDAAAVLAVPASEALLTEVAGLAPDEGAQGLIDAIEAAVLRETGIGRYTFRHVLAQQVAHRHIPGPRRVRLHLRAIDVLETQTPAPLVQIAHHTLGTGDHEKWLVRTEQAADQALELGDTGTAATMLRQILNQQEVPTEQRSRAALALARIANSGVDYARTSGMLRSVLADLRLPEAVRGEIRLGLGLLMLNLAGDTAGFHELERAVEELATLPDKAARAMIALALRDQDVSATHAWTWLARAEQAVRDSTSEGIRTAVRSTRLMLMAREDDPAVWPLADSLPRRHTDRAVLGQTCYALYNLSETAVLLGHDRRARRYLLETQELAERTNHRTFTCLTSIGLLHFDWLAGRWAELEAQYAALALAYPDVRLADVDRALCLGHLALAQGRISRALEHFTAAAAHGDEMCSAIVSTAAAAALTTANLALGEPRTAWAIAEPALRRRGTWVRATGLFPVAVEAALACGHREVAEQLVADAGQDVRDAPAAAAELALARGRLLRETAPAAAAEHFADACRRWQDIGRPYYAAKAAELHGTVLAHSDAADAAGHLAEVLRTYVDLGATADAARCQHHLRSLGAGEPSSRGRTGYGNELSPREQEVAQLLARGATNADIAHTLFLSPRTVEKHVARVLAKLGTARKDVRAALQAVPGLSGE
ncbi:ATP-binding protein [Lentzea sp. NPDC004789]